MVYHETCRDFTNNLKKNPKISVVFVHRKTDNASCAEMLIIDKNNFYETYTKEIIVLKYFKFTVNQK